MTQQQSVPLVTIIIVSWNVRDLLHDCLQSIEETKGDLAVDTIVVDNHSSDCSGDMVKRDFPDVYLIELDDNQGFGSANNVALNHTRSPYILLLNPDTLLLNGTLQKLISILEANPDLGIAGPQILDKNRQVDKTCRRFPTLPATLHQFTCLKYFRIFKSAYLHYMMHDFDHQSEISVDQIMGACMMVRSSVFDAIGLFDENFFMYYEEVDLCYRAKQKGFNIIFSPSARIIHFSDQSTQQIWDDMLLQKIKSLFYYYSKRYNRITLNCFKLIFKPGLVIKVTKDVVENYIKSVISHVTHDSTRHNKYLNRARQSKSFLRKYVVSLLKL